MVTDAMFTTKFYLLPTTTITLLLQLYIRYIDIPHITTATAYKEVPLYSII